MAPLSYMSISMIYATSLTGAIGYQGDMPWPHLESDMKWFRRHTIGKVVLMGRATWDSLGQKKLPDRISVVLSRSEVKGADMSTGGDALGVIARIQKAYPGKEIVIIGGAQIYKSFMLLADTIYTTLVQEVYEGDTYFDCRALLQEAYHLKESTQIPETHVSPGVLLEVWKRPTH